MVVLWAGSLVEKMVELVEKMVVLTETMSAGWMAA
jgi:hypothetical protein